MILNFTLDNEPFSEELSILSPLSHFLSDKGKEGFRLNPSLLKLVLVNNVLVSSRHMPLLFVNNSHILTKEGITHTLTFQAIQQALKEKSLFFCSQCRASRTILFYHLLQDQKRDHFQELWRFHESQVCYCLSFTSLYESFLLTETILQEISL